MANISSVQVQVELGGVAEASRGLKEVSDNFKEATGSAEGFQNTSKKFSEMGALFKTVGKQMTKYLTVPIMGAIAGMGKMFGNIEYEIARVGTLTSDAFDLTGYTQDLLDQSKLTGVDMTQLSKNVYTALTASVPEEYVMDFVFDAHKLSTAGFTDEATAIDVLTTAINAYGYEASDANKISDMLIGTQDRGKTTVDELGKSLGDVIPIASDNNLSFEELSASMALLTRNGIGTARASTYTRSMLQELGKTGSRSDVALRELAGKGFRELMDEGYNLSDVLQMLDGHASDNDLTLQDMFGNIRAGTGAMSLMSGDGEHLAELIDYMGDVAGRTDENFEDMSQTMQYRTRIAFNRLKTAGYETALSLAPVWEKVADVMDSVAVTVEKGVKWFTSLSDATQGNIIKGALFVAVLGPLLTMLGGIFTVIGTVSGAMALMAGSAGAVAGATAVATPAVAGLATVLGIISNPVTLAIVGVGLLTATVVTMARGLKEDAIPGVQLFGEEVSETTAEAVSDFLEMSKGVSEAFKEVSWSQQTMTAEVAEDLKEKQAVMTEDLLGAIAERHEAERTETLKQFDSISALTETEKANILAKLDERYEDESIEVREGQARINEIIEDALADGGILREDHAREIDKIIRDMEETAVEVLSDSALEQEAILAQMALNSKTITAQEAVDVARNSEEKRDAVVEDAQEQFEETYKYAVRQRDETGDMSAEEASRVIREAELKRKGVVEKAEEMHTQVLEEAQKQSDGHVTITEDGELKVLDLWDNMWIEIKKFGNWISRDTISSFRETTTTVETESGKQEMGSRKNWEKMSGNMDKSMDKVDISARTGLGATLATVEGTYSSFELAGSGISRMIADGVSRSGGLIGSALSGALSLARNILPFSPPKDKTSPMYGIEDNGISSNIAEGILKGEGEIDFAMRRVLRNDMAGDYQRRNSVTKGKGRSQGSSQDHVKQPVELVVKLGNHTFRKFVDDITNIQDKEIGFENSYGL